MKKHRNCTPQDRKMRGERIKKANREWRTRVRAALDHMAKLEAAKRAESEGA